MLFCVAIPIGVANKIKLIPKKKQRPTGKVSIFVSEKN
jgi:hypothetical protein